MIEERYQFLLNCQQNAQEELILRIKNRSRLLVTNLIVQSSLFILTIGGTVGLFKIELSKSQPLLLIAVAPVALLFASLYIVEDYLVDHASKYLAALTEFEARFMNSNVRIPTMDAALLPTFSVFTTPLRSTISALAFVLPVLYSVVVRAYTRPLNEIGLAQWEWASIVVDAVIAGIVVWLFFCATRYRISGNKVSTEVLKYAADIRTFGT
ncbi:MAG: hypothetical protein AAF959_02190 [Cyanobacteria bacterium P01_D01_bin.56]